MKRICLIIGCLVVLGIGRNASAQTCVTNLYSNLVYNPSNQCLNTMKKTKMVIHQNDSSWVSYTVGFFYKGADGVARATASQLFDNRTFFRSGIGAQEFDRAQADSHTIAITAAGAITITNHTWGFTTNLTASCSGNLILASNGWEYYTISFGAAQSVIC